MAIKEDIERATKESKDYLDRCNKRTYITDEEEANFLRMVAMIVRGEIHPSPGSLENYAGILDWINEKHQKLVEERRHQR